MRFILISAYISVILAFTQALASDYPKSRTEREMDKMGSLLEGEGIVFRPFKEKSTSTKTKTGSANKYLYNSGLGELKNFPLSSSDATGGTIITDWYDVKDQKGVKRKITIYIKGDVISPETLEVVVFERNKNGNQYSSTDSDKLKEISSNLEREIIRKARKMYIDSKKED